MTSSPISILHGAVGAFVALSAPAWLAATGAASPPVAPVVTNAAAPPKAVFAMDLPNGRDPFFPDTLRFKRVEPGEKQHVERAVNRLDQLFLKGVSISDKRRLALVNNQTLAEGEKAEVKLSSGTVVIQCLEVTERSVLILAVETKEKRRLNLRKEL